MKNNYIFEKRDTKHTCTVIFIMIRLIKKVHFKTTLSLKIHGLLVLGKGPTNKGKRKWCHQAMEAHTERFKNQANFPCLVLSYTQSFLSRTVLILARQNLHPHYTNTGTLVVKVTTRDKNWPHIKYGIINNAKNCRIASPCLFYATENF